MMRDLKEGLGDSDEKKVIRWNKREWTLLRTLGTTEDRRVRHPAKRTAGKRRINPPHGWRMNIEEATVLRQAPP